MHRLFGPIVGLTLFSVGSAAMKLDAKIAMQRAGDNPIVFTLTGSDGKPLAGAKFTLAVQMTNMNMGVAHPAVTDKGEGKYGATVKFSMAGPWRVTAQVDAKGEKTLKKNFDFKVADSSEMGDMPMGDMKSRLGDWSMARDGSGTSWLPDSSPMFMKMLPKSGRYNLNAMGFFTLNTTSTSGPRGDSRFYSNSMPMLMARRETGRGILGFSLMMSLDALFNGEFGYPDLFQTGETAHGIKLTDYQHPHDLFDEAVATYSHPVGHGLNGFAYAGPVGEPALGGPTFVHRPSGNEIPEAPISHHWFDSTHISWGVATVGLNNNQWQLEASAFNGHEPDENRYAPDPIRFDSASTRLTFNPDKDLSLNVSYGYLHAPESTEPGVDQHRLTSAALWSHNLSSKDNLSITGAFGRNIKTGSNTDSWLVEATYLTGPTSIFARFERVEKDELIGVPAGTYTINKLLFGGVRNVYAEQGFDLGIGAYAGIYSFPASLDPFYGKSPFTYGFFVRLRPSRM